MFFSKYKLLIFEPTVPIKRIDCFRKQFFKLKYGYVVLIADFVAILEEVMKVGRF